MTKTIVIGDNNSLTGKPIEFVKEMNEIPVKKTLINPHDYDNIELICRDYWGYGMDLMFAYFDDDRDNGVAFLGHWNSGIVNE